MKTLIFTIALISIFSVYAETAKIDHDHDKEITEASVMIFVPGEPTETIKLSKSDIELIKKLYNNKNLPRCAINSVLTTSANDPNCNTFDDYNYLHVDKYYDNGKFVSVTTCEVFILKKGNEEVGTFYSAVGATNEARYLQAEGKCIYPF